MLFGPESPGVPRRCPFSPPRRRRRPTSSPPPTIPRGRTATRRRSTEPPPPPAPAATGAGGRVLQSGSAGESEHALDRRNDQHLGTFPSGQGAEDAAISPRRREQGHHLP